MPKGSGPSAVPITIVVMERPRMVPSAFRSK